MSAVSVIDNDQFWPTETSGLFDDRLAPNLWRSEVRMMEDDLAMRAEMELDYHLPELVVLEVPPRAAKRSLRRIVKRHRLRGVRPTNEVELRTTRWYRRYKNKRRPMLKCTATLPLRTRQGRVEMRTRRRRYAPAPNRRLALVPPIDGEETDDEEVADGPVGKNLPAVYGRRVFDPALDEQRAALMTELRKLEVELLFKLRACQRRPIENRLTALRRLLRDLDAITASSAA